MVHILPIKDRLAFSLSELLEKKPIQNISVSEISRNASVSLRSFYNYYTDKYQVAGRACLNSITRDSPGEGTASKTNRFILCRYFSIFPCPLL